MEPVQPRIVTPYRPLAGRVSDADSRLFPVPRSLFPGRRGFTLVELTVSIGILALMLSLAGVVFKWTLDSTGQAQALTDVNEHLRQFENELREDLANVDPANSLMVLQTNFANAHWTKAGREVDNDRNPLNGYPHPADPERENTYPAMNANNPAMLAPGALLPPRVDVLMFFTSRAGKSFIDPTQNAYVRQVVYGHAEQGELNAAGTLTIAPGDYLSDPNLTSAELHATVAAWPPGTNFDAMTTVAHPRTAQELHLARRSVLISNLPDNTGNATAWNVPQLVTPALSAWTMDLEMNGLGHECVLDGCNDVVGRFVGPAGGTTFDFGSTILGLSPAAPPLSTPPLTGPMTGVPIPRRWYARSRLDPTPPPNLVSRLGAYLLPNCASFKVEWTCIGRSGPANVDLDQTIWFDMQRPNPQPAGGTPTAPFWDIDSDMPPNSGNMGNEQCLQNQPPYASAPADLNMNMIPDAVEELDALYAALQDRFIVPGLTSPYITPDIDVTTPIWYARNPYPTSPGTIEPDPFFPTALRITVDVFDPNSRFERPIRHVFVVKVGA